MSAVPVINDVDTKYKSAIENIENLYRLLDVILHRGPLTLSADLPQHPADYTPPLRDVLGEYIDVVLEGDKARQELLSRREHLPNTSISIINDKQYRALELMYQLAVPEWRIIYHEVKSYYSYHYTYPVIGIKYQDNYEDLLAELRNGWPIDLVPEPENPHDPKAVAVMIQGRRIGYLPRNMNRWVSKKLTQEPHVLVAYVADVVPEKRSLKIDVYERNAQE